MSTTAKILVTPRALTRDAINRGAWKEIADACKAAINRVAESRGRATRKD